MDQFKPVSFQLSPPGPFDARAPADSQVAGALAWRQNIETSSDGKTKTASGFVRPYGIQTIVQTNGVPCPYKNWDFSDQDVADSAVEPPTLLYDSTANDNTRRLYMGTKTRLFLMDEKNGAWTQLTESAALGQDGDASLTQTRWHCDQLQDKIFFANGYDQLQYTEVGTTTVQPVTSLNSAGEDDNGNSAAIEQPQVVKQYQGVILIMNVVEAGKSRPSRIWWSDLNDGTSFGVAVPNTSNSASLSDFQDLDYGERILGAIELLGYLYVLTDKSIWQCTFTASSTTDTSGNAVASATLSCNRVYSESEQRSRCLWYPNTLTTDGESIYYAGHDAIYRYNPYMSIPERTDWIFQSTSLIFDEGVNGSSIDQTSTESPVAAYWPDRKEIHFSWPVPDAKFIGTPTCDVVAPLTSSGLNRHTLVINTQWHTCDYREYGMNAYVSWNPTLVVSGSMDTGIQFWGSLTDDYCLKQLGIGNSREIYTRATKKYAANGYYWILRGEFDLKNFDYDKQIKAVIVDGYTPASSSNVFSLRLGMSYTNQNINANNGNCGIVWHTPSPQPIKCLMTMTPDQYATSGIRPSYAHRFNWLLRGRLLFFELTGKRSDGSAPYDGGVTLTRLTCLAIDA
jgi:hypothetical protein